MLDILLDCLSETWLIILMVLFMVAFAKYDEYKQKKKKWRRNYLSIRNGGLFDAAKNSR